MIRTVSWRKNIYAASQTKTSLHWIS